MKKRRQPSPARNDKLRKFRGRACKGASMPVLRERKSCRKVMGRFWLKSENAFVQSGCG